MSKLEKMLNHAETLTKQILDSEIDYGSESYILKLISALRKAIEMHHELTSRVMDNSAQWILNSKYEEEILQILEGE